MTDRNDRRPELTHVVPTPDRRPNGHRGIRYTIGAALAVAALLASLRGVSHDAVREAIHSARTDWTLASLAATLLTLAFVTWRWGVLLGLDARAHWSRLWNAVLIGQAVNIVFPLRFGEAARVASMSRMTGWPIGRVAAALAVERVSDAAAFAAIVLLLIVFGRLPPEFARPVPTLLAIAGLTMALVVVSVMLLPKVAAFLPASAAGRAGQWLLLQANAAGQALRLLRGGRVLAVVLLTGLVLTVSASANYLVFRAFDLPVPVSAAFVLLAVLQIGTAIVSVPGNVGIFQYLTVLTLANWNVPESTALAASLVLHAVSLGPRVVLGVIGALAMGRVR